jgi:hypothetical protein
VVTYTGTSAALGVRLYATATGGLADNLALTIDTGTGAAGAGSCTGFSVTTAGVYAGTLRHLADTASGWGTGLGSWTPPAGSKLTYRFTISVPTTAAAAEGTTAAATFTWEPHA